MGISSTLIPIYLLAAFLCAETQFYQPYGQYGYSPYTQYPYPYPYQQYQQPYVSNQPSYGYNYGYPQNYAPVNYPAYNYPVQTYPQQAYNPYPYPTNPQNSSYPQTYAPVNYPAYNYPVQSYPQQAYTPYPYSTNPANATQDPYANLKVEIIDVEPSNFQYYKRFFNLQDNTYPVDVDDQTNNGQVQTQYQPYYIVKKESKSYNYSSVPQSISKHDVKSKTFSFKKTFTVDPSKKQNSVINLNFVNGVQVTDTPTLATYEEGTTVAPVTEEATTTVTTTESEEPDAIVSWLN